MRIEASIFQPEGYRDPQDDPSFVKDIARQHGRVIFVCDEPVPKHGGQHKELLVTDRLERLPRDGRWILKVEPTGEVSYYTPGV